MNKAVFLESKPKVFDWDDVRRVESLEIDPNSDHKDELDNVPHIDMITT